MADQLYSGARIHAPILATCPAEGSAQSSILRTVARVPAGAGRARAPVPVARSPARERADRRERRYRLPNSRSPASRRILRLPALWDGPPVACSSHRTEMGTGTMMSDTSDIETKTLRTIRVSTARQRRIAWYPRRAHRPRRDGLCRPRAETFKHDRGTQLELAETQPDA